MGEISIKVDENQKVGYIEIQEGNIDRTISISDNILFDVDKSGQVIGIELLSLTPNIHFSE